MRPRLQNHYVLASLFTLGLIAAALLWVVDSRLTEFRINQSAMAENAVRELTKQVTRELQEKKHLAVLFGGNERRLIEHLIAAPDDDELRG